MFLSETLINWFIAKTSITKITSPNCPIPSIWTLFENYCAELECFFNYPLQMLIFDNQLEIKTHNLQLRQQCRHFV